MAAFSQAVGKNNLLSFAPAAEETDSPQSWPGLFWLPPADDEPAERDMLHLDDELAGLVEAADKSADKHEMHTTKPEPLPSAPGESFLTTKVKSAAALSNMCCAVLRCAVLCRAVLHHVKMRYIAAW